ncbi:MAG: hypothetical protein HYX91_02880 [Chloroflexi bacterium]|nr:hypothetical protein [Chloroflexota bacterium]
MWLISQDVSFRLSVFIMKNDTPEIVAKTDNSYPTTRLRAKGARAKQVCMRLINEADIVVSGVEVNSKKET